MIFQQSERRERPGFEPLVCGTVVQPRNDEARREDGRAVALLGERAVVGVLEQRAQKLLIATLEHHLQRVLQFGRASLGGVLLLNQDAARLPKMGIVNESANRNESRTWSMTLSRSR